MAFEGFMKGNEAAAEAAVRAGCRCYFFYPLTPQSEIGEYLVTRMPEVGGVVLQAESEVAAINMVFGAAATGKRTMTSSSGCGISLMSEGLSYIAAAEVPVVIVDVMRGGPGLGSLLPTQADYYQVVKGGGHGGYRMPVFGSADVQELADNVFEAFDVAEKYRTPVAVLIDPITGQMMEAVEFPAPVPPKAPPAWALTGCAGRKKNVIRTGYGPNLPPHTEALYQKYGRMKDELQRWEEHETADADIILVGFGIVGRILKTVTAEARARGLKVGLIRPITMWPFPERGFAAASGKDVDFLTVEMNDGQMYEDVIVAVGDRRKVHFLRSYGALVPKTDEILAKIEELAGRKRS